MKRYLCIHGHFYQPPRENPWLEAIEIQDTANPYHDWNERVNAECYSPNSASRILDGENRIMEIVNNYEKISFNFGPTLLSWMEENSPEGYKAILEADKKSIDHFSGHGNAIAQVYNHIIMPLSNSQDKRTQVIWGIRDFEYRFRRFPEGMWLSETAVDLETLDILAEMRIKFTILAPHQAAKTKRIGATKWKDVNGSKIDPTKVYLCRLPSGRNINIFFYDGPISQSVAFEKILNRGENFASKILTGFSDLRDWPQILNIATDGETYGHHKKFGDMALAYAIRYIESNNLAKLTNYGEYLEKYPPICEVQLFENTSWSCCHGIERWRSNCGCSSMQHPEWNQEWRTPLRDAMDWLSNVVNLNYEKMAGKFLRNPWSARDEYIEIILNRGKENIRSFFEKHSTRILEEKEMITTLKLLEAQRNSMLMYTSCGWFFDELSGLETVQVIQYAGRTIQLLKEFSINDIEELYLNKLAEAKSNIPEHQDGASIYNKFVKPTAIDLISVSAHYALSSLFEEYPENTSICCFKLERKDYQKTKTDKTNLAIGKIIITSEITLESELVSFCVFYFGNHALNGGVRSFLGDEAYHSMKSEIGSAFEKGAFDDIIRMMDKHFGMHNYSLSHLFKDNQRKVLNFIIGNTIEDFKNSYQSLYYKNLTLMRFLKDSEIPIPREFLTVAEFTLSFDTEKIFLEEEPDIEKINNLINDIKRLNLKIDSLNLEFIVRGRMERMMNNFYTNPSDLLLLLKLQKILELLKSLPVGINLWQIQNIYYKMAKTTYKEFLVKAASGDSNASNWMDAFKNLGEMLFFNTNSILQ